MKRTDKAFWLTIVPSVLVWNLVRDPVLDALTGGRATETPFSGAGVWSRTAFAGDLGLVAGYVAAYLARPQCLRGAGNLAVGLLLSLGVQNVVDYRGAGLPVVSYVLAPAAAAVGAVLAGLICRFQHGGALHD